MSAPEPEEWSPEGLCEHVWDIDRKSHDRRFAFILGAGASVQSGIPAAGALVRRWLAELHRRLARGGAPLERWATAAALGIPGFAFERAPSFYSQVFARRFRQHPDEGYADLEDIMQGKDPSFGYSVLAHVLAETRHKLVITTNFDNLVGEALSIFTGTAPLVCGHESLANFIRLVPRRPVVVKIHRDLLMAPMNREDEIATLQGPWIEPLTRVFSAYTPIVIGYGGNDGSLMNFLRGLPAGAIAGGIFWCYWGPGGPPGPEICELVAHHRGALVPIEGFDELMLRLGDRLGVPLLDQVIEKKAQVRVENYRRRFEELQRSILARPAELDDAAVDEPAPPARREPSAEGLRPAPPVPAVSPGSGPALAAPPVRSASAQQAAPPTPSPVRSASPSPDPAPVAAATARAGGERPTRGPARGPARGIESTRSPAPAAASPAPPQPAPLPPIEARPGPSPDRTPALSDSSPAPREEAEDDVGPAFSQPVEGDVFDLSVETEESPRLLSARELEPDASNYVSGPLLSMPAGVAPLQRALQRLAADGGDASPWSALMQARAEPDRERAIALLRAALARFPGDRELQLGLAERLADAPDMEAVLEAISILDDVLRADGDNNRALRHLALLHAWRADPPAAAGALARAWAQVRSPPVVPRIALVAFIGGLLARLQDRDDTRALAILKAAVLGRVPEAGLPQPLVTAILLRLDPPSQRLYSHLLRMFAGRLRPGRVAAFEPRFAAIAPADLGGLAATDLS